MKIAVLSDIHSNVFALENVLSDIKKKRVDIILNLGDIFYGPIAPLATYQLLRQVEMISVRGNQDREVIAAIDFSDIQNPTLQFVLDELRGDPLNWMRSLPIDYYYDRLIYACHGTPNDDSIYLLEKIDRGLPVVRTNKEIIQLIGGIACSIIVCGHSHLPRTLVLANKQMIINAGSVGLPAYAEVEPEKHLMETYSPHAHYVILEKRKHHWSVQHNAVSYNYDKAAKEAIKRGRDDWAAYLTTGRAV